LSKRKETKEKDTTNTARLRAANRLATAKAPACAALFVDTHAQKPGFELISKLKFWGHLIRSKCVMARKKYGRAQARRKEAYFFLDLFWFVTLSEVEWVDQAKKEQNEDTQSKATVKLF